jgi:hypothetical protein
MLCLDALDSIDFLWNDDTKAVLESMVGLQKQASATIAIEVVAIGISSVNCNSIDTYTYTKW